jgi:hypothetical protein
VTQHLAEPALDDLPPFVAVVLQGLAHIGQQRSRHQVIVIDRDAFAERLAEHLLDRKALPDARVDVLDEPQIDVAGQQRERDLPQLLDRPPLAPAARRDGIVPHGRDVVPQRGVSDGHEVGKQLCDLVGD